MTRVRISTTVDESLLGKAREIFDGRTDASLVEAALLALVAQHREADIEAAYRAYDEHPLDEPDAWGDLASFRRAASAS